MRSPFEDLQIDGALVCEFFAVFARFEYAMKASRYCTSDRWNNAVPDWRALKQDLGPALEQAPDNDLGRAMAFLLDAPPLVQKWVDRRPKFQEVPLAGNSDGAKVLESAKRVRNNLFHGGKHTPHSPPDRDTQLIKAALCVLQHCLEIDRDHPIHLECFWKKSGP